MPFDEYIPFSPDSDEYTPPPPHPVFFVTGSFGSDGTVDVASVRGQDSTAYLSGVRSDAELILIDASHRELARAPLCQDIGHVVLAPQPDWKPSDGVGCSYFVSQHFNAEVPASLGGVALVIRRGSVVLWTQAIDRSRPTVLLLSCEAVGDVVRVTSTSETAEKTRAQMGVEFTVAAHRDAWRPVDNRMHAHDPSAADFDLIQLPPGRVLIRLILDDGFYTVPSNALELDVPAHPLEIEISAPVAAMIPEGLGKLSVEAVAREWRGHGWSDNGVIHDRKAYRWMLDNVSLGRGKTILIDPPPIGLHTLTVTVKFNNKEARASIAFEMTDELIGAIESARPWIAVARAMFPHIDWSKSTTPP